jgi:hypothetical protein
LGEEIVEHCKKHGDIYHKKPKVLVMYRAYGNLKLVYFSNTQMVDHPLCYDVHSFRIVGEGSQKFEANGRFKCLV